MAMYQLSEQELLMILDYVNGENSDVLKTDTPQRFINLAAAFSSKLFKSYSSEKAHAGRLERTNERMVGRLQKQTEAGNFSELRINVVDAALCIVYLLKEGGFYYSRARVQYILYEAYRSWLVSKKERLLDARPVVQAWGPHFWEISKKISIAPPVTTIEDFRRVANRDAGVAEFLKNVVNKYGGWEEEALKSMHVNTVAYKNAKPRKPGEGIVVEDTKWGRVISDADIYNWAR